MSNPTGHEQLSFQDEEDILKRRKRLQGNKIYVNEDFTVRQKRTELWPKLREARDKGMVAHL